MADVELVIKIPEEMAYRFKHEGEQRHYDYHTVLTACIKGIQLPKGHGRLIDADALKKDDEVTEWLSINPIRTGKMLSQF